MLTVYTVSSTANTGAGSLRDAITQANSHTGADEIAFAPELSGKTVELSSSQLLISGNLVVDATSLPGGVTIDGNLSTRLLYINSGVSVELRGLTLTGASAPSAEGSIVNYGTLLVDSCTVIENADEGVWNAGTVTISRSFFRHNMGIHGGALYNGGNATVIDSTFAENAGGYYQIPVIEHVGGSGRSLTIERSTIGGNEHSLDIEGEGTSIRDSTFFGTIYSYTTRVVINNSIVVGNVYALAQAKYSLLADANPTWVAGVGNLLNTDPQLGPLADNGGRTPTYAVLSTSPALNAGDPTFVATTGQTDQRGGPYGRQVGRLDMGAYEAQATPTRTPGDFNADGRVDAADFVIWRKTSGTTVSPLTAGDATGDGLVDDADYRSWRTHFGFVPLAGKLVVNDLSDRNDGNIYNGRLTLREAIDFSKTVTWADSITFDPSLSGGVIQVGSQGVFVGPLYYQIEKKLTIDARMLPGGITLNAGGRTAGLYIDGYTRDTANNYDVTLAGLTITGGVGFSSGGGGISSFTTGKLTVIDCQLLGNNSSSSGLTGAVSARGNLELVDTVIDGAVALGTSGTSSAVFADGNVTLLRTTIRNVGDATHRNFGVYAGIVTFSQFHLVTLTDSQITNTTGGGVAAYGHVQMERSRIENNQGPGVLAPQFSGSGSSYLAGNVTLIDSTVSNNTSFSGVDFQGAKAGSGIVAGGNVILTRSRVESNRVTQYQSVRGGGIAANGDVTATDSFINGNNAEVGGGIYARGFDAQGSPTAGEVILSLVGTAVNNNESQLGGAAIDAFGSISIGTSTISGNKLLRTFTTGQPTGIVLLDTTLSGHTLTIADSVLTGNSGLLSFNTQITHALAAANIEITRSQVVDNQMNGIFATRVVDSTIARNAGIGVSGSRIDILGSTVSENHGGVTGTDLHIQDSTIRANAGGNAGAFATGTILVERSLVADNQTTSMFSGQQVAGGLWASTVVLVDSTVRDNTVSGPGVRGGGIFAAFVQAYGSTISGNAAIGQDARGGGIYTSSSNRFRQSTVSGNRAEGPGAQGGGIWSTNLDAMQITVVGNQATGDLAEGGGIYTGTANRVVGGILANNTATSSAPDLRAIAVDPGATTPGVAYSLVRDSNGSPLSTGGGGVGNLLSVDPLLGPLADNGGPTRTHAPLPGSPLIDAGDPTLTSVPLTIGTTFPPPIVIAGIYDQRGQPFNRVVDGGSGTQRIDIGAVEVQPPGTASRNDFGVPPAAPFVSATSPAFAAAVDAALSEVADDDLLLLIDTDPLVAERTDAAEPAHRSATNSGSIHDDHVAISSLADSLSTVRIVSIRFTPRRMI
jgi:hypothetical protein